MRTCIRAVNTPAVDTTVFSSTPDMTEYKTSVQDSLSTYGTMEHKAQPLPSIKHQAPDARDTQCPPGSDSIVDHDSSMYVPCCATSLSFTASLQVGNIGGFCLTLSLMKHTGDTASACHTQHCLAMFCWPAISEVLVMRSRGVFRKR